MKTIPKTHSRSIVLIVLVLGLNSIHAIVAQNQIMVDSLNQVLEGKVSDEERVDVWNQLAEIHVKDSLKVANYVSKAISLSKKTNYAKGVCESYYHIAYATMQRKNYLQAHILFDSLLQMALEAKYPKGEAKAHYGMGVLYFLQEKYPEALHFFLQSLKISKRLDDKPGMVAVNMNLGLVSYRQSNYAQALKYYLACLKGNKEIGNKKNLSIAYSNVGLVYGRQGNYEKALDFYLQSLKLNEELGDQSRVARSYNSIGVLYIEQGDYSHALEYSLRALRVRKKAGIKQGLPASYNNIGYIFYNQEKYDSAYVFYQKAISILNKTKGKRRLLALCYSNIADVLTKQNQLDSVLYYAESSLLIASAARNQRVIARANIILGRYYQSKGYHAKAIEYLKEGVDIAERTGNLEEAKMGFEALYEAYKTLHNFSLSLKNYEMYMVLKDSMSNEESRKKTVRQSMQYKLDKQEALAKAAAERKELVYQQELERHRYYIYVSAIGGLAMFIIAGLIFRGYRQKLRDNALLAQQSEEILTQRDKIEEERQQSEKLLLNILPQETARELKKRGYATPRSYDKVSVLFTDFEGFTKLAEKMSEEKVVANLDYCFRNFDRIIKKHNLEKIKTIGDAYMCAGGIPTANDTNPIDTINAAKEMKSFMDTWIAEKEAKGEEAWRLRLGIHTGKVVAGVVGENKFAYDIWGDAVNIASRMESSGKPDKINISGDTYEFVKGLFQCEYRGKVEAKNKGEVDMYFVE